MKTELEELAKVSKSRVTAWAVADAILSDPKLRRGLRGEASRRHVADAVVLALAAGAIVGAVFAQMFGGDPGPFVGLGSGLIFACAAYFFAGVR